MYLTATADFQLRLFSEGEHPTAINLNQNWSDIASEINTINSNLSALEDSVETAISNITAAYQAADSAIQGSLMSYITGLSGIIAGKADYTNLGSQQTVASSQRIWTGTAHKTWTDIQTLAETGTEGLTGVLQIIYYEKQTPPNGVPGLYAKAGLLLVENGVITGIRKRTDITTLYNRNPLKSEIDSEFISNPTLVYYDEP